ncbi:WD40 repeat domain-containing serine/threonine protein kinase [Nocardiopsis salina]|uniref:WD40 repeat domain-containing serine/threonine protein kinase n=1 Tax=Nocardiopsis salina TaxID=245836 RepID=UPI000345BD87|nr:serine/threonine-protein kinase [Nocardiopsis salina]
MYPLDRDDPRRVGPYRIAAVIGSGAMGHVYLGLDARERPAAVKVVRPEYAYDPGFRAGFATELELARRVHGPGVPRVLAADARAEEPWLATEYVPGPSLQELVETAGPLPAPSALFAARATAGALAEVHGRGLAHLDLKPANVMAAPSGPLLIDFGIARAVDSSHTADGNDETHIIGSPGYMAPEASRGERPGPPADVFALGGILVWTLTGAGPFGDGHPSSVLYRSEHQDPDLSRVPQKWRGLLAACLDKDPERRPTSAEVLRTLGGPVDPAPAPSGWLAPAGAAAAEAVGDRFLQTLRTTEHGRASPGFRRRNALSAATAALALALLATALTGTHSGPWPTDSEDGETTAARACDPAEDLADTFTEDAADRPTIPGTDERRTPTTFSNDGSVLAVGGGEGIALWDWRNGEEIALIDAYVVEGYAEAVFSPDDCRIGYADFDGVHVYSLDTGEYEVFFEDNVTFDLDFSPDGSSLAAGGVIMDGVHSVDFGTGDITTYEGPFGSDAVAYSPGGDHLVAVGEGEGLWMWDTETGEVLAEAPDAVAGVGTNLDVPNDDGDVVYATADGPVHENLLEGGDALAYVFEERAYREEASGLLRDTALDPVHDIVHAHYRSDSDPDGEIMSFLGMWDFETGDVLTDRVEIERAFDDITPHPHGEVLAASGLTDVEILLLDPETLDVLERFG